jgi:kynurenine--oxoglutarate transaminase/cysteine-S-conjugate beta-lyase/glutamine--phenylpyruvate transaminase
MVHFYSSFPGWVCLTTLLFQVVCLRESSGFVPSINQQQFHAYERAGQNIQFREKSQRLTATSNSRGDNDGENTIAAPQQQQQQQQQPPNGGLAMNSPGEATQRLGASTGPTVWTEFGRIAQEHDPVNLGQGFPDWLPPKFAVDSLVEAVLDSAQSPHQYTRPAGHPNLVGQLARRYSIHLKKEIDPMEEVAVTVGASQALYLSLQTLVQPGDEVVLFEPFFDLYVNQVKLAGGTPVFVPLRFDPYNDNDNVNSGGEWKLDRDELMNVVSPRTKAIILNSPHNPTGKIFSRAEMEVIAESLDLAGPDCVVLSDEVYKYIVHAPPKDVDSGGSSLCPGHTHFASLPGMWDRTITISSAGKTFSATGWQAGW